MGDSFKEGKGERGTGGERDEDIEGERKKERKRE
jgi:hypothetical protein